MPVELKHYVMGAIIVAVVGVLLLALFLKTKQEPLTTLVGPVVEPVTTPEEAEEAVSGSVEDLQAVSDELEELDRILE